IRVIADLVLLKSGNNILTPPPFEHPRLFADKFERGADVPLGEHLAKAFGRIIIGRQQIILGIEPKNDIDCGFLFGDVGRRSSGGHFEEQDNEKKERVKEWGKTLSKNEAMH